MVGLLKEQTLSDDGLATLLAEVEAILWDIKMVIGCLYHGKFSWWHDVFSHEVFCSVMWCHVTGVLTEKRIVLSFNLMWEDNFTHAVSFLVA